MHPTDDVHARSAVMTARVLVAQVEPIVFDDVVLSTLGSGFTHARRVTLAEMEAHYGPAEWSANDVARMKVLNTSDAALARAFDEA